MKLLKDIRFYRFLIPSLIGAFLFVIPIDQNGNLTIPIAVVANKLLDLLGESMRTIIWALISGSAIVTVLHRFLNLGFLKKNEKLDSLFSVRGFWFWTRMTGFLFANMIYFGIISTIFVAVSILLQNHFKKTNPTKGVKLATYIVLGVAVLVSYLACMILSR